MIGISKLYCGTVEASDPLRYGRRSDRLPSHLLQFSRDRKPVVVFNCTRRCNLRCAHCYSASADATGTGELSTGQAKALLDDLAGFGCPVVLFSGGEPLLRPDILELVAHARAGGLRAVLSTNGTRIDAALADRLAEAGLSYVGVSLDGLEATHDRFRGQGGAFGAALAGIRACRDRGVKVGLRMTVTRHNVHEVPGIFDLIEREGIPRVCFYHLVYTGRGAELAGDDLSHPATRALLDTLMDRTRRLHEAGRPVEVLTVDNHADGPYVYLRLLREDPARAAEALALLRMNRGNSTGHAIGCVSWNGDVHPDQFWRDKVLGNVLQTPFSRLWGDQAPPLLRALRDRKEHLLGRCRRCRWLDVCNGNFRARAEAATGELWGDDPACYLTDEEIRPAPDLPGPHRRPVRMSPSPRQPDAGPVPPLRLLFWESTSRCNLRCVHCRRIETDAPPADELSTAEARALLDDLAELGRGQPAPPVFVFSGGEPLLRGDWFELAEHARRLHLPTALATNGTQVDALLAGRIAEAAIRRVSVSLDGPDATTHDAFRGQPGCFGAALDGIAHLRAAGVEVQINASISRHNLERLNELHSLARRVGAVALHLFLLVPVGCGAAMDEAQRLTPAQYERVLEWIIDREADSRLALKATCAPHYFRVRAMRDDEPAEPARPASPLHSATRGCLGGIGVAFVSCRGKVFPCGYLPVEAGDIRREPLSAIWRDSATFRSLRDYEQLKGTCGRCDFRDRCGGCRARAYAATGDMLAAEPMCAYRPPARQPR